MFVWVAEDTQARTTLTHISVICRDRNQGPRNRQVGVRVLFPPDEGSPPSGRRMYIQKFLESHRKPTPCSTLPKAAFPLLIFIHESVGTSSGTHALASRGTVSTATNTCQSAEGVNA